MLYGTTFVLDTSVQIPARYCTSKCLASKEKLLYIMKFFTFLLCSSSGIKKTYVHNVKQTSPPSESIPENKSLSTELLKTKRHFWLFQFLITCWRVKKMILNLMKCDVPTQQQLILAVSHLEAKEERRKSSPKTLGILYFNCMNFVEILTCRKIDMHSPTQYQPI